LKEIRVFDDENDVYRDLPLKGTELSHGQNVEIIEIFKKGGLKFNRLEIVLHDPNTKQDTKQLVNLIEWNQPDHAISKIGAHLKLKNSNFNYDERKALSIRY
jgi:hypothetical protein